MARHPSGDLLVGTQNKGLLLYDGETFHSFAPKLTSYLQENADHNTNDGTDTDPEAGHNTSNQD